MMTIMNFVASWQVIGNQWIKELDNVTYSNGGGCTNKVFLNSSYDTRYLYDVIKKYYVKGE